MSPRFSSRISSALALLAIAACATPRASDEKARFIWKAGDGTRLEQVALDVRDGGEQISGRIRSDAPLSQARRTILVNAIAADGSTLATSTARLEFETFDRAPAGLAHVATFSAPVASTAADHFELSLAPAASR